MCFYKFEKKKQTQRLYTAQREKDELTIRNPACLLRGLKRVLCEKRFQDVSSIV